jgi:hypothetical protein
MQVVGCPPHIMGIGPAVAIPVALKKAGLGIMDIDIYEINEAFGSQAAYSVDVLGIPEERVNPKGAPCGGRTPRPGPRESWPGGGGRRRHRARPPVRLHGQPPGERRQR